MPIRYNIQKDPLAIKPAISLPRELEAKLGSGLSASGVIEQNSHEILSGSDKVKQNMYICLATPVGRHLGQPDYGSLIPYLTFTHFTSLLQREVTKHVKDALATWLDYIVVKNVFVSATDNNTMEIAIDFYIKASTSLEAVTIVLANPDNTQLVPSRFTIHGVGFFQRVS